MTKSEPQKTSIETLLHENRKFKPQKKLFNNYFLKDMSQYFKLYKKSINDPLKFWEKMALEHLDFFRKWKKVFSWKDFKAEWFSGALINVSYNCLDRHVITDRKNKAALIWEGEPGDIRTITYQQLLLEVANCANMLKGIGLKSGDKAAIYMPLIPEAVVTMLACTRIGVIHTVVFGGFSSSSLRDRIQDSNCKALITADGGFRKGSSVKMKEMADEALKETPTVKAVIVVKRTNEKVNMMPNRDFWWHELSQKYSDHCEPEKLSAEHPLFILYTSGTTGKPKGLLHTTAGYLLGVTLTAKYLFDIKEKDIYWCTADVGWVTGHSYLVYGPLSCGATVFMYEGAPLYPEPDRFWKMIAKHKITILYTAPTAIRSFIRLGKEYPQKHDLSSLRLLGTVGEPINPEAWIWYYEVIGHKKCPIVDTWWQTETGAAMIAPFSGVTPTKPGSATLPMFGIEPLILNKNGSNSKEGGFLCIKKPWPYMARTIYGDHERYKKTYWKEIEGVYFTGDGARRDKDGYFWIMGRVDDVINVSGHRLGTMEIESAAVEHPMVAECAVVGRPDSIKGQGIVAFITLKKSATVNHSLKEEISKFIIKQIGALAKPDEIRFTDALPKTRSGKIMRRLLRELATTGSISGDTTTLEDFSVLEKLRESDEE
ncbi:acetate--CoA ligase [Fluviispira multicolorata]|uniref:Acetyl-coenzyme A synthetase n=1 Tax=Fluviispira multicolorata TaxID=2654512 RepID=A0A833N5Z6_9BACT|nr:acetate--CoA ligase [Fluviispira multicolorata]KAB8029094.1 acetate--CoA ligase [Fluviispira multicolorata]